MARRNKKSRQAVEQFRQKQRAGSYSSSNGNGSNGQSQLKQFAGVATIDRERGVTCPGCGKDYYNVAEGIRECSGCGAVFEAAYPRAVYLSKENCIQCPACGRTKRIQEEALVRCACGTHYHTSLSNQLSNAFIDRVHGGVNCPICHHTYLCKFYDGQVVRCQHCHQEFKVVEPPQPRRPSWLDAYRLW